ncbi:hypothetical protein QQP08_023911 [Theobroma cacao]|nr:hypothetical protein QQP08_023911 [Theobroma cacao]
MLFWSFFHIPASKIFFSPFSSLISLFSVLQTLFSRFLASSFSC